jgi:hypothetical protein
MLSSAPLPVIPSVARNLLLLSFTRFLVGRLGDLLGDRIGSRRAPDRKKTCCHKSLISDTNRPSGAVKRFTIF